MHHEVCFFYMPLTAMLVTVSRHHLENPYLRLKCCWQEQGCKREPCHRASNDYPACSEQQACMQIWQVSLLQVAQVAFDLLRCFVN